MTHYLIAVLDTDDAAHPRYMSGEIVPGAEVKGRIRDLLASHAPPCNAQMREEAQTAGWQLDRWHGEPARFCGYLTRYDLYPVQEGSYASEYLWREMTQRHERAARYRTAREHMARIGITAGDPDFRAVESWLMQGDAGRVSDRASDLEAFRALALREDIAPWLTAYRPWQWALATAKSGDSVRTVKRELLAEVAQRQAASRG